MTPPLVCHAPTASHDGIEPRRYYGHGIGVRRTTVLCRGCAAVAEAMGAGWILDRRDDPQRADRVFDWRTPRRMAEFQTVGRR